MGRTILCNSCGTIYPLEKIKDVKVCPVCNVPFDDNSDHMESPSFGDDIELSENDSFDEDKIERWWYSISEPGKYGVTDTGMVGTTCTKCNYLSVAPYPIAKCGDYLLIDARYTGKCGGCGNIMKNHILSKRPDSWVDSKTTRNVGKRLYQYSKVSSVQFQQDT